MSSEFCGVIICQRKAGGETTVDGKSDQTSPTTSAFLIAGGSFWRLQ